MLWRWPLLWLFFLWFNRGHSSFERVLEELGVLPPHDLVALGTSRDSTRQKKMSQKLKGEARARRRALKKKSLVEESARKSREGQTYGAGAF